MPTYFGQTVDLLEDFEDALGASWAETDPDTNLDPLNASANHNGTYGMRIDSNGATAGGDVAYLRYNTTAERTDLSIGFWFRGPTYAGATINAEIFLWGAATAGTNNLRGYYRKASGVYSLAIRGTAFSSNINVSADTWYWLTIDLNKNATSTLRVYNIAGAQVGSDVTATAGNNVCQYLYWGATAAGPDENVNSDWDDAVSDWTDATWPLLGWAAGRTSKNTHPWTLGMALGMERGVGGVCS